MSPQEQQARRLRTLGNRIVGDELTKLRNEVNWSRQAIDYLRGVLDGAGIKYKVPIRDAPEKTPGA